MFYLIEESLREISQEELKDSKEQFVAVLSSEEWEKYRLSSEV